MTSPPSLHGWLVLDKPVGPSSMQALAAVRRALGIKKIGHTGTLDPLASGVLPLAVGEATKLIDYIMLGQKTYDFTIKFGENTSTDDAEGEVLATSPHRPSAAEITAALPHFVGVISQIPPAFSAIKVGGVRAYAAARKGANLALAARPTTIHALRLLATPSPELATLQVVCGKGTYVRALARDLAVALGTVGHVVMLRRVAAAPFNLSQAITLDAVSKMGHEELRQQVLPIGAALDDILALPVTGSEARQLSQGKFLAGPAPNNPNTPQLAMCGQTPIALLNWREGCWRPVRVFNLWKE